MNEIRKKILTLRKSLSEEERQKVFKKILAQFFSLDIYKSSQHILAYFGKTSSGEFDTTPLMKRILEDKKILYLPKCVPNEIDLDIYQVSDIDGDVEVGAYNLMEPKSSLPEGNFSDLDIILIPGLVFDHKGNRYGYGKGYYDSYLSRRKDNKPYFIAFSLDFGIVDFELPHHAHDIPIDIVISESKLFHRKA